jgi:sugar O-acyltransferase (sialic acid O-acetyltransferase NeuD family)
MLIVGAKGFAKELLEVCYQLGISDELVFFDNKSDDIPDYLFDVYPVLTSDTQVIDYFQNNRANFSLGVGNPFLRKEMALKFKFLGGQLTSVISPFSNIGHFQNIISPGVNIMTGSIITNNVKIGEGCLINLNCTIGHDVTIGNYCEICPGVNISGNVQIGNYSFIGSGTTILPGVTIGNEVVIGAGSVVTRNIMDFQKVKGVPAK